MVDLREGRRSRGEAAAYPAGIPPDGWGEPPARCRGAFVPSKHDANDHHRQPLDDRCCTPFAVATA